MTTKQKYGMAAVATLGIGVMGFAGWWIGGMGGRAEAARSEPVAVAVSPEVVAAAPAVEPPATPVAEVKPDVLVWQTNFGVNPQQRVEIEKATAEQQARAAVQAAQIQKLRAQIQELQAKQREMRVAAAQNGTTMSPEELRARQQELTTLTLQLQRLQEQGTLIRASGVQVEGGTLQLNGDGGKLVLQMNGQTVTPEGAIVVKDVQGTVTITGNGKVGGQVQGTRDGARAGGAGGLP